MTCWLPPLGSLARHNSPISKQSITSEVTHYGDTWRRLACARIKQPLTPRHALELRLCLGESAQLEKRVAADTWSELVGLETPLTANRIDALAARCGIEKPRH